MWRQYSCTNGKINYESLCTLRYDGSMMILFVGFGWAKPVPVDSRLLRNSRTAMMKVAAAGPIANLLLALVSGLLFRLLNPGILPESIAILIYYFTRINITSVFNLIPVAPMMGLKFFLDIS